MGLSTEFRNKNEERIIEYLNNSYDVKNDPDHLLRRSAYYGLDNVLMACLEEGINPNSDEALIWACGGGRLKTLKILINAGAELNIKDKCDLTPIIMSAGHGKLNEVKFLLEKGAKIDGALLAAVSGEYIKVVEYLLECNPNLEETSKSHNLTALANACASHTKKAAQVALLLIKAGADVNFIRESDEQTPLKFAARRSSTEVIRALIENGADIDGPTGTAQTALMLAARSNSVERVQTLLEYGANQDLECGLPWAKNATAQGLAEMEKCKKVVKFFNEQ